VVKEVSNGSIERARKLERKEKKEKKGPGKAANNNLLRVRVRAK
jgi:hypothetical protein